MTRPDRDVLRILDGRFFPNDIPGVARPVPVACVRGFALDTQHAFANQVVAEGLSPEAADAAIEAVIAFFRARESAFQWLVHIGREPLDLVTRLAEWGLERSGRFAGLLLRDLSVPIPEAADVTVRAVDRDEALRHAGILERGFGLPADAVAAYAAYRSSFSDTFRVTSYLAYFADRPEPVAYAESVHAPGTSTVLLGGAATEAEFRGRGAYRALLARRLCDARTAGADTALILAERATSAPICTRIGFREIAALEAWVWQPWRSSRSV